MMATSSGAPALTSLHEEIGMGAVVLASQLLDFFVGSQFRLRVVAHAAVVFEDDVRQTRAQVRHGVLDLEQLVHLFLILDHREIDFGVVQHIAHVGRRRILVQRDRHPAQALCGRHRPVQARPVVADHRQVHAALEAERGQAAGQRPHFAATCVQSAVCQMPRSFSRKAGLCGRTCACCNNSRGNVCAPGLCVVSTIVPSCRLETDNDVSSLLPPVVPACRSGRSCAGRLGRLCDDSNRWVRAKMSFQGQFTDFRYCIAP